MKKENKFKSFLTSNEQYYLSTLVRPFSICSHLLPIWNWGDFLKCYVIIVSLSVNSAVVLQVRFLQLVRLYLMIPLIWLLHCIYSKALRYVTSRCANLADTWFWIGSKNKQIFADFFLKFREHSPKFALGKSHKPNIWLVWNFPRTKCRIRQGLSVLPRV